MAGRDDLAARVAAVLEDARVRGPLGRRGAARLVVTAAVAIVGIAPITVVRATPQRQPSITNVPRLRFESVSLKRNVGDDWRTSRSYFTDHAGGTAGVGPDGQVQWLQATNVTARLLLFSAYGHDLRGDHGIGNMHQFDNVPDWIDSDRFDVIAKAPSRSTPQQMREMMQSLLAERFGLAAHIGSKDFPIYALVLSRSDGNLGPRITRSGVRLQVQPRSVFTVWPREQPWKAGRT
jgi:hypothetical protein